MKRLVKLLDEYKRWEFVTKTTIEVLGKNAYSINIEASLSLRTCLKKPPFAIPYTAMEIVRKSV